MAAAPGRKVTGEGVLGAWDPPTPPLLALSPSLQGPGEDINTPDKTTGPPDSPGNA